MILIEDKTISEQNYFYICNPKIGYRGRAARQWSATPSTAVRIRSIPQHLNPCSQ
tara:strand:+ start:1132 stop:1296 length:165 start_codon:yes stop_codon:yes gene_type:complete